MSPFEREEQPKPNAAVLENFEAFRLHNANWTTLRDKSGKRGWPEGTRTFPGNAFLLRFTGKDGSVIEEVCSSEQVIALADMLRNQVVLDG